MLTVDPNTGAVTKPSWSWGGILLAAALLGGGTMALGRIAGGCHCHCHEVDEDLSRLEDESAGNYPPIEVQLRAIEADEDEAAADDSYDEPE